MYIFYQPPTDVVTSPESCKHIRKKKKLKQVNTYLRVLIGIWGYDYMHIRLWKIMNGQALIKVITIDTLHS